MTIAEEMKNAGRKYQGPAAKLVDHVTFVALDDAIAIAIAHKAVRDAQDRWMACPGHDATCPCQDGDSCHYRGEGAMEPCGGFGS